MEKKDILDATGLALVIILIAYLFLTSCNTVKQAERQTKHALIFHPEVVAKIARDAFPCVIKKTDTTYNLFDTTIIADCPPVTPATDYFPSPYIGGVDTLFWQPEKPKFVKVPVTIQLPGRTITITKMDSAYAKLVLINNAELAGENKQLQKDIDTKRQWIKWLIIFLTGLSIPYIIKMVTYFKGGFISSIIKK